MKISAINQNYFKVQNSKLNEIKKQTHSIQKETLKQPTFAHYLSFCAGYTVNLNETFEHLKEEDYPSDIQEMVLTEIENKNPDNKTLYDIHFEKYKGILDCYSLDELKEKYPEFESVVSAYDVIAKDNSFIGQFQNNELELFSNDEDLTLQLIKLYWGQGFSLTDLSNHIAKQDKNGKGKNLYYAMNNKLNIPFMNPRYASVLKLSNKEYNEKFTSLLAIKLKEAKEAKIQQQEGEPVVIPRGELSEAHKKHISESLKKHYQEHPEKLFEMSKRQKAFYQENPDKAQEMSEVMLYAWNETQEGKSLMKHISKFIRKFNGSTINAQELANFSKLDSGKKSALNAFWQKNGWAKKQLSIAMKKAFEYKKDDKEDLKKKSEAIKKIRLTGKTIPFVQLSYNVVPTQLQNDIKAWAKAQGYDTKGMLFGVATMYNDDASFMENEYVKDFQNKVNEITEKYYDLHPQEPDAIATSLQYALVNLQVDLARNNIKSLPPSLRKNDGKLNVIKYAFNNIIAAGNPIFKEYLGRLIPAEGVDVNDIHIAYNAILYQAMVCGCEDLAQYLNKKLDEGYEKYKKEVK